MLSSIVRDDQPRVSLSAPSAADNATFSHYTSQRGDAAKTGEGVAPMEKGA